MTPETDAINETVLSAIRRRRALRGGDVSVSDDGTAEATSAAPVRRGGTAKPVARTVKVKSFPDPDTNDRAPRRAARGGQVAPGQGQTKMQGQRRRSLERGLPVAEPTGNPASLTGLSAQRPPAATQTPGDSNLTDKIRTGASGGLQSLVSALADQPAPSATYLRARARLPYDTAIGADGLEAQYSRDHMKRQIVFFAKMVDAFHFDRFVQPRVWFAAQMESRITFLNNILALHSKAYDLTPAVIHDRFTGDLPTMPRSIVNRTGLTGYEPETRRILAYPPVWNGEVSFDAMIGQIIEQNTRNHARQLASAYTRGELRVSDPRYYQAAIFALQIEAFEELLAETKNEEEVDALDSTAFLTGGEIGFDTHARRAGETIRAQLGALIEA